jgi:hypothetical protein
LRRVAASNCGRLNDAKGCFKQDSGAAGVRNDVLEMPTSAFDLDKDLEDTTGGKTTRYDFSGAKIESLPSQDVALHETGHAVESAPLRQAEAAVAKADVQANKSQDAANAAAAKISVPAVSVAFFSSNRAESAYQHALFDTSKSLMDLIAAINVPSDEHSAAIANNLTKFKAALKDAQKCVKKLLAKKDLLPSRSSVVRDDLETTFQESLAAGVELAAALDARLAAQKAIDSGDAAQNAASAVIAADRKAGRNELHISRRLADLVALVELKKINIKGSGLSDHVKNNWPNNPEELFADLFQMSFTEAPGLKVFDVDLSAFFQEPIGPKGPRKKDTADWIKKHKP